MKKNVLVTLLTLSVFSVLVSGCGSTETTAEQTETAGDDAAETDETEEEAAEGTETQEEEAAQDWTLEEWLDAQSFTEYTYCLWNETDHEGTVIEYGGTYDYNSDDELFVLYTPEEIDSVSGFPSEVTVNNYKSEGNYNSRNLFFYDSAVFDMTITSVSGTEYHCNFTLVSPETAPAKVEKEFSYYLQTDEGENLIGFNMPDNYTFDWAYDRMTQFRQNNDFLGISTSGHDVYDADDSSFDPVYEKVYEYTSTETQQQMTQTDSYLPVGTTETIYGTAKLFLHEMSSVDSATGDADYVYIEEDAFLYYPAMNTYFEIYYKPGDYSWPSSAYNPPTLEDYNYTGTIEALLEELFN